MTTSDPPERLTPLFALYPLDLAVSDLVRTSLAGSGVMPSDYAFLSAVRVAGQITPTDLAHQLGTPKATMTDWVTAKVAAGLVVREPSPLDGRSYVIRLSPEGEAAHSRARECFGRGYLAFVEAYDGDIDELQAVLARMTEAARTATQVIAGGE